ncbi:MAG: DUF1707 domain-containing protein [Streptosporangiaceae bacterium]
MSWERDADEVAGGAGAVSGVLASDADRDAVAGLLSEAFAEGRLSAGEHGERVRAAYAARTWGELARLTTDLPVRAGDAAGRPAATPDGLGRCLLCALRVLCPPAGIAWLLAARRRPRPGRGQKLALGPAAAWAGHPAWPQPGDVPPPATGAPGAVPDAARARAGGR